MDDRHRYPAGKNLVKHWQATGEKGSFGMTVEGSRARLLLEWEITQGETLAFLSVVATWTGASIENFTGEESTGIVNITCDFLEIPLP